MKHIMVEPTRILFSVVGLLMSVVLASPAADIISFDNGELTFGNTISGETYTVEWAPALTGSWYSSWSSLTGITSTGAAVTVEVPMFYRVATGDVGGVACTGTSSPLGRWCDNGDGTVTDTSNGLVWLKNAGWGGTKPWADCITWDDAHTRAGTLEAGASGAGLSDGSVEGDWRLPTLSELVALTTGTEAVSSSAMYKFTGVVSSLYWSCTTSADDLSLAWVVYLLNGNVGPVNKDVMYFVWPVRGGP